MKPSIFILSATATLALIGMTAWFFTDDRKAEVAAVRQRFASMPDVKVTYITDLEKQASQSITADLEVEGKGGIRFTALEPGSFELPQHVLLTGIEEYAFRTRQRVGDQESYGYAIDVGPQSPIPAVKSLGINNVQSAVLHYDELRALFATWPATTQEWPADWPPREGQWDRISREEVHFVDSPRGDYCFCRKRLDPSTNE